jgi:hypothetical protein
MTLRLEPSQTPTVFAPLTIFATVQSSSPQSGSVQIRLGAASCSASLSASGAASCTLIPLAAGAQFVDASLGTAVTANLPVEIAKAVSSTNLLSDPAATEAGSLANFKVMLTGTPGATRGPTGRVTVTNEDGAAVCEVEVDTSGAGSCLTRLTEAGAFVFTASYGGDDYYEPSTAARWTHIVGEALAVRGKGRVAVVYDTRDSAPCQLFGTGSAPFCSEVQTGSFDVGVADTVTYPGIGSFKISASARGGATRSGTLESSTYTGFFQAHLETPALDGATSEAGNGWVLDLVVPRPSTYELRINLSIRKNFTPASVCRAVLIAAFQYLVDGDVEDGQGLGAGGGGNCGSRHNWPAEREQVFTGTLPTGTYRLFMSSQDPVYPDAEDWGISNSEFGRPLSISDTGWMDVSGAISLTLNPIP